MKSVGGGVHQLRRKVVFSVLYVDAARVRAAARLRERRAATSMVICARERVRREKEPKERRAFAWSTFEMRLLRPRVRGENWGGVRDSKNPGLRNTDREEVRTTNRPQALSTPR